MNQGEVGVGVILLLFIGRLVLSQNKTRTVMDDYEMLVYTAV